MGLFNRNKSKIEIKTLYTFVVANEQIDNDVAQLLISQGINHFMVKESSFLPLFEESKKHKHENKIVTAYDEDPTNFGFHFTDFLMKQKNNEPLDDPTFLFFGEAQKSENSEPFNYGIFQYFDLK